MTTLMTQNQDTQIAVKDYADFYKRSAQDKDKGRYQYIRFTKYGRWVIGKEREEIADDVDFAVNFRSLSHGVIGWENKQKVWDELVHVSMPFKSIDELMAERPIHKKSSTDTSGYNIQHGMKGVFLSDKLEASFSAGTVGAEHFIHALMAEIGAEASAHPEYPNPIIHFTSDSYEHPTYGLTYKPTFEVVGWCNDNLERWEPNLRLSDEAKSLLG